MPKSLQGTTCRSDSASGDAQLYNDAPISYIERVRTYYHALGYRVPYRWAQFADVPFTPLEKPLARCRIALVTTAAPYQEGVGDQGPGAPYNSRAKFYKVYSQSIAGEPDVRISHIAYDRKHTTAEDANCWFPLKQLKQFEAKGKIGQVVERFLGAPTNRSQRTTMEQDCPEILKRVQEDKADAVLLVANCPVCHQSVSLVARHLEAGGFSTVVMGCAKDIVEHVGVPRFLFSDFPLGNAAGKPNDARSQAITLELALNVLSTAREPRTTVRSPLRWSNSSDWKLDYCNIAHIPPEDIAQLRKDFDAQKAIAKERRLKE